MEYALDQAVEILARTPGVLRAMLGGISAAWQTSNASETTWSPTDVLGHLIHGEETDWIPRAQIILAESGDKVFPPFDQHGHKAKFAGMSADELLDLFEERRTESIETLKRFRLSEADLDRTGLHPEFGTVTLRQHLATWVVHDLNHLNQIARSMAVRYASDVGPWKQYLSILKR